MPPALPSHASPVPGSPLPDLRDLRPSSPDLLPANMDAAVNRATGPSASSAPTSPAAAPVAASTASSDPSPGHSSQAKRHDKHSAGHMIRSGIAGGLAGCAAKTTVAPLDRVKILFQTSNPQFAKYSNSWAGFGRALYDIYARDGPTGLFRGHSATLLKIYPYAAIKFVAYEQYRALIIGSRDQETWLRRFTAGALAGVSSVFMTYPLEVIRVRLAFETKHRSSSLADICKKIYHEHPLPAATAGTAASNGVATAAADSVRAVAPRTGIINFYRGFSTTLLGMVPYAGVSFLTHDAVGDIFRLPSLRESATLPRPANAPSDKPAPLRAWAELTAGGLSGAVSQTVSYPLEVIRRRMQVGGAVGDGHRLRIGETAGMIFRERGLPGFFVGLTIGYVKVIPLAAVSFYTYERLKTLLGI